MELTEKQLEELVHNSGTEKEYGRGRSPMQDAFREFRRNTGTTRHSPQS